MRPTILSALLLGLSTPAFAAQPPATQPPAARSPRPATPPPAIPDAARIAAAGRLVELMMPPGSMRDLMADWMPNVDTIMAMTAEQFGIDTEGMSREQRARAVEARGTQGDRHFRERLQITMDVTLRVTGEVLAEMEPDMRRVMTTLLARQFDQAELAEMTAFFTTPTGRRYARLSVTMGQDPAWQEIFTLMTPRMTAAAGRIEAAVRSATAHLDPQPRT